MEKKSFFLAFELIYYTYFDEEVKKIVWVEGKYTSHFYLSSCWLGCLEQNYSPVSLDSAQQTVVLRVKVKACKGKWSFPTKSVTLCSGNINGEVNISRKVHVHINHNDLLYIYICSGTDSLISEVFYTSGIYIASSISVRIVLCWYFLLCLWASNVCQTELKSKRFTTQLK